MKKTPSRRVRLPQLNEFSIFDLEEDFNQVVYKIQLPSAWIDASYALSQETKGRIKVKRLLFKDLLFAYFPSVLYVHSINAIYLLKEPDVDFFDSIAFAYKLWLREQFSKLEDDILDSTLNPIQGTNLSYEKFVLDKNAIVGTDEQYSLVPYVLAKQAAEALKSVKVADHSLDFYYSPNRNGELISYPEKTDDSTDYISYVIKFYLRTFIDRKKPVIFPEFSIRRWYHLPLIEEGKKATKESDEIKPKNRIPFNGTKVFIYCEETLLESDEKSSIFIPCTIKTHKTEAGYQPSYTKSIATLIRDRLSCSFPDAETICKEHHLTYVASNPRQSFRVFAVPYRSDFGGTIMQPGVAPKDVTSFTSEIIERLPLRLVDAKAKGIPARSDSFIEDYNANNHLPEHIKTKERQDNVLLLRPSVIQSLLPIYSLNQILILYVKDELRNAAINYLEFWLGLAFKEEIKEQTHLNTKFTRCYQTSIGQDFFISYIHSQELIKPLGEKEDGQRRIETICGLLPESDGRTAVLQEIYDKSFYKPKKDPYKANKLALGNLGYISNRIIITKTEEGEEKKKKKKKNEEENKIDYKYQIESSCLDIVTEWGFLPKNLINNYDELPLKTWILAAYLIRKTKATTFSKGTKVMLVARINPEKGEVSYTTPSIRSSKGWISFAEMSQELVHLRLDMDYVPEGVNEVTEASKMTCFITDCLHDCLKPSNSLGKDSQALLFLEAQNSRSVFKWLQNKNISFKLPDLLKQKLGNLSKRFSLVRLVSKDDNDVPPYFAKTDNGDGGRYKGIFKLEGICDNPQNAIWYHIRRLLQTEQHLIRKDQQKIEKATRSSGYPPALEVNVLHHHIPEENLHQFIDSLRYRYNNLYGATELPIPFKYAEKLRFFAVGLTEMRNDENESEDADHDSQVQ